MACFCRCSGANLDTSTMHPKILRLTFLVIGGGIVFDGSAEVQSGLEEFCDSGVVFCEDLDDCWKTEDSWGGLMTELFNRGGTVITGDENSLLFGWLSLLLKHRLSRGIFCFLPWFFPVPLLWQLPMPFGRGMINAIWVCGGVVCLLFCSLMSNKRREPTFWRDNCSHVLFLILRIKLITSFLSQYNPK